MKSELNILMLEDNASDAELVQHELRRGGLHFRAGCVQTQKAFVHALEHNAPDVILSDHGLPAFNGFEAMAVANRKCPDVPFIFVTGLSDGEKEIETFESEAIDYVLKKRLSRLVPVVKRAVREAGERAARRKQEAALRDSEERFRALIEGVRDYAICMLDERGRVTSWNAGAEWMEGYRADEIIGQHFSQFYATESVAVGQPALALVWAVTLGRFEEETLLVRKDRFPYWAHLVITPLRNEREELTGFAFIARDVTALKQSEAEWERTLTQLDSALADVKILSGLLPVCASCRRVGDFQGQWHALETFLHTPGSTAASAPRFCPDCAPQM